MNTFPAFAKNVLVTVLLFLTTTYCSGQITDFSVGGILKAGNWWPIEDIQTSTDDHKRNGLIAVLYNNTSNSVEYYQAKTDAELVGIGALLVILSDAGIYTTDVAKRWSDDHLRNIVIDLIYKNSNHEVNILQSMSNIDLASIVNTNFAKPFMDTISSYTGFFTQNSGKWSTIKDIRSFADVNGDRRADLIGIENDSIYVALGLSNGTFGNKFCALTRYFCTVEGWNNSHVRLFADANGDGRNDIIGFGDSQVHVSFGQTDGTFTPSHPASNEFCNNTGWTTTSHVRCVADVNGDHLADIVGFGNDHVWVGLGLTDGTFAPSINGNADFFLFKNAGWDVSVNPRLLGDVNGDMMADIVGFGNENVYVALGQSNGTFGPYFIASGDFCFNSSWRIDQHVRKLADLNGDGRDDIVGFGNDAVWAALGQKDGTFGAIYNLHADFFLKKTNGWTVADHIRDVVDINGDNKADIAGIGAAEVFVSLGNWTLVNTRNFKFAATADPQYNGENRVNYPLVDGLLASISARLNDYDLRGLIIAGDLTQDTQKGEIKEFYKNFIEGIDPEDQNNTLNDINKLVEASDKMKRVYEGLGNHDLTYGTCCAGVGTFYNCNCPEDMLEISMRPNRIGQNKNNYEGVVSSWNKIHYTWDWNGVHFVQLNLKPSDKKTVGTDASSSDFDPYYALLFLIRDLKQNATDGRPVILIHHYGFDSFSNTWWTDAEQRAYWDAIAPYNVVAILTGHKHTPIVQAPIFFKRPVGKTNGPDSVRTYVVGPACGSDNDGNNGYWYEFNVVGDEMIITQMQYNKLTGISTPRYSNRISIAMKPVR